MNQQCLQIEQDYREWSEAPHWYCVKTVYHNNGKIESEIVVDEKTGNPIVLQMVDKPQDGVYATATATTYYTYHQGYEEAARQLKLARM